MKLETEFANFKKFLGFELKFPVFTTLSKFQVFSRHGKENDKIPGFQGFPGRVGTLMTYTQYFELTL